ncbi:MAG: vitamin K epoxide reductase family protein [Actinomycetota bacterium]|nr:vitamin K epoxide reductase family protein [Actinomycetota bacterium]
MTATAVTEAGTDGAIPAPWPALVTFVLCIAGAGISGYLTYVHFNNPTGLACPATGIIDCAKVVTSSYSVIAGVPVPVAGLAFFVAMAALCSPWAWRSARPVLRWIRVAGAVSGVVMISWLIYAELFRLDALCLWCTSVHVITVLLFIAVAFTTASVTAVRVPADD